MHPIWITTFGPSSGFLIFNLFVSLRDVSGDNPHESMKLNNVKEWSWWFVLEIVKERELKNIEKALQQWRVEWLVILWVNLAIRKWYIEKYQFGLLRRVLPECWCLDSCKTMELFPQRLGICSCSDVEAENWNWKEKP
jgi:hypothetical protein